ncbi:MAG: hypothetical protein ACREQ4_12790, partial [Candidatus Binataceae bacterium]
GVLFAVEEERLEGSLISGARRSADGLYRLEVRARIGPAGAPEYLELRCTRALFDRKASYTADDDSLRGSISALAGRNEVVVKLGRFREVDADLILFKALVLAHIRARGQALWTGRVAVIDPVSLSAAALKQSWRQLDELARLWAFEPRMGDREEVEADDDGRILRRRDARGAEIRLVSFAPAAAR